MSSLLLKRFGKHIREERLRCNLSQEKLAELAKVHRTYIGMIERGEKNLSLTSIEKLSNALEIPLKKLLDF